jgi:L-fuculose-phosphate aldolase
MTQSDTATSNDPSDEQVKVNGRPLDEVKVAVLAAAKRMYARGLVEGTAGNVSGRVDDGTVVVTPSSLGYEEMTLDDLVQVTLDGEVVSGERSPTSEKMVHLSAFAAYPEVGGVVHCHAKYASMYAVAHQPIPAAIDEFIVYIGGPVPCCDYFASGSDGLGPEVASKLVDRSAALMANHGLVAIGKSVDDALHSAMVVEHNAQIFWGAKLLGGVVELSENDQRNFTGVYNYIREYTWMS